MIAGAMLARSRGRYLAPIALVAVIAGTYLVIHQGLRSQPKSAAQHPRTRHHTRGRYARARHYVIQPGDSMTSISAKTGVALTTIESLNPGLDPNSLQTGGRLRLR